MCVAFEPQSRHAPKVSAALTRASYSAMILFRLHRDKKIEWPSLNVATTAMLPHRANRHCFQGCRDIDLVLGRSVFQPPAFESSFALAAGNHGTPPYAAGQRAAACRKPHAGQLGLSLAEAGRACCREMGTGMFRLVLAIILSASCVAPLADDFIDTGTHALYPVAAGVYAAAPLYGGSNAMVVIDDDFVLVVDTHSGPAGAAGLVDAIRQFTDVPVRYVVNTHWHIDHHSGNAAYRAAFPGDVVFVAHHTTREDISTLGREQFDDAAEYRLKDIETARGLLEVGLNSHGEPLSTGQREALEDYVRKQTEFSGQTDFEFTLPDLTMSRKLTIHGSQHTIDILYFFPAHTRGDIVVHLREASVLAAGDVLTQPILWTWASQPTQYIRTLESLRALAPQRIIMGHGGPIVDGEDYLVTALGFLRTTVDLAARSYRNGQDLETARARAGYDPGVAKSRAAFIAADSEAADMFDKMFEWTFDRAWEEQVGIEPE